MGRGWGGVATNCEGDSWGLGRFGCRNDEARWAAKWDSLHAGRLFEGAHLLRRAGALVASLSALGLPRSVGPMVRCPATRGRYIIDKRGMGAVGLRASKEKRCQPPAPA